jgi:hypothetical protein
MWNEINFIMKIHNYTRKNYISPWNNINIVNINILD